MIRPTSATQLAASTEGGTPGLERITDDTWVLGLPLPAGRGATVPYTLCYVVLDADGAAHLIDPGFGSDGNAALVDAALAALHVSAVRTAVITHLHPDHLGMAGRLRRERSALIVLHPREQRAIDVVNGGSASILPSSAGWGAPPGAIAELPRGSAGGTVALDAPADLLVEDDALLDVPGRRIRVLLTPGHTPGHISLRDEDQGLLLTGDHVLPTVYPGLGLGGPTERSPIAEYLDALDRIHGFDDDEVLPGHGYRFRGLAERIDAIRAHHLRRGAEIAAVLAERPHATTWEIASRVRWTAGWANLSGFVLHSALAQTEMYVRYLARS